MGQARDAAYYGLGFVGAAPVGGGDPVQFAALKGVSVNFTKSLVALQAQYKYPLGFGDGDCSVKGKIDSMTIFGGSLAAVLGGSAVTGQEILIPDEAHAIPASTSYDVTATHAADFGSNFGVFNVTDQVMMVEHETTPAANVYTVTSGGVYTFAAANASDNICLIYSYTAAATGKTVTIENSIAKVSKLFRLSCVTADTEATGGVLYAIFPTVAFGNLSWDTKDKAWTVTNVEFEACADVDEDICTISTQL